ncbi:hypothetical protein RchiOBHm_Chr5g0047841 [Rosa chinensis]|uniref:Uncharacterized protein n=1 Tax=Rosa chinensis TaxID=74649 RepID=A0A2P6QEH2_ROSCH|nr:hypothetical protein RchiOBHm_Chr5g0047841 [Rosa chinensis]
MSFGSLCGSSPFSLAVEEILRSGGDLQFPVLCLLHSALWVFDRDSDRHPSSLPVKFLQLHRGGAVYCVAWVVFIWACLIWALRSFFPFVCWLTLVYI